MYVNNENINIDSVTLSNTTKKEGSYLKKNKNPDFIDLFRIPSENILLDHYYIKDYSGNNNHIKLVNKKQECNIDLSTLSLLG